MSFGGLVFGMTKSQVERRLGKPESIQGRCWMYPDDVGKYLAGVRRIDAAPTAVAATIEPVVGTLLALLLFDQRLSPLGWLGLAMVVGGVAAGYLKEAQERPDET